MHPRQVLQAHHTLAEPTGLQCLGTAYAAQQAAMQRWGHPAAVVQQRHIAFALKAKSTRARGPSALHAASELATGSDAREVEVLIRGVESVELLENEG